jgi:hypothetical protein
VVVEYTYFKIRRGQYEHVLRTLKDWREVMDYLAGKFSEQKDVGGPSLPPSTPS